MTQTKLKIEADNWKFDLKIIAIKVSLRIREIVLIGFNAQKSRCLVQHSLYWE